MEEIPILRVVVGKDQLMPSPALFYETEQEKALYFSKTTEILGNMRPQDGNNKATYSNPEHVFNVNQSE